MFAPDESVLTLNANAVVLFTVLELFIENAQKQYYFT